MSNLPTSQPTTNSQKSAPWYKNYVMTIFVIGLPAFVVVACVCFVFYSFKIKDSTVRDDWYMDGKSLYQDASKDKLAHDLGLSGVMRFDGDVVVFELKNTNTKAKFSYPKTLDVKVSHATDKTKDLDFKLTRQADNRYSTDQKINLAAGKYYLNVSSDTDGWRLTQSQKFPAQNVVFLPLKAFDEARQALPDQRDKRSGQHAN